MNHQKFSNKNFKIFSINKKLSKTEKAGRYKSHIGLEKYIFRDIVKKLKLKKNDEFLDIGCGLGNLSDYFIKYCVKNKINLTLCDIPEVIDILKKKYSKFENIDFLGGEFQNEKINKKFDKILCYSVIQCVNDPKTFFKKMLNCLSIEGKLLIGDLPNVNKKYRFLKSNFGIKFEEKRINKKIEVKNMKTFLKLTKQNKLINDEFINFIINYSRKKNRNSIIMKQPIKLPFSYTREDVLIEEI
jgi:cyclopropane fatty-acyl-phospholipid synthase-like methyltransferase